MPPGLTNPLGARASTSTRGHGHALSASRHAGRLLDRRGGLVGLYRAKQSGRDRVCIFENSIIEAPDEGFSTLTTQCKVG